MRCVAAERKGVLLGLLRQRRCLLLPSGVVWLNGHREQSFFECVFRPQSVEVFGRRFLPPLDTAAELLPIHLSIRDMKKVVLQQV